MKDRQSLMPTYSPPKELVFTHGKGSYLFSQDGTPYLDLISGIGTTIFGHSHPKLIDNLKKQVDKLWHTSNMFRIPQAEMLAKKLVESSFADRVFLANSGTEAIEASLKCIRRYHHETGSPERKEIISMEGSFHGRSISTIAAAGKPEYTKGYLTGEEGFRQVAWGDIKALQASINSKTAGVIIETIQGEGGVRPVTTQFLTEVKMLCEQNNILLCLDEVQCGVGRSGYLFAYERHNIKPDIIALAKGLGGGFPIGACLTTEDIGQYMVVGSHGSTFGGNPLATTVALTVLQQIESENILEKVRENGFFLKSKLLELYQKYPHIFKSVHGEGFMIGVKCIPENNVIQQKAKEQNIIIGKAGDNMIRLLPPLNISQAEITQGLNVLENIAKNF